MACRSIKPEQPDYQASDRVYRPVPSTLSIPVEIPLSLISERINQAFSGLIYNDDSFTRPDADNLKVKVYMNRQITLNAQGNEVRFTIPLSVHATGRWSACVICPEVLGSTSFEMDVFLRSALEIKPDYRFTMNTRAEGFEWKRPPVVAVGPLKIPVARLLEGVLNKQLQQIASDLDKAVAKQLNLRAPVQALWELSHTPVMLDDSSQTWLRVKPEQIRMNPIDGNDQRIRIGLGLVAFIETHTGQTPPFLTPSKLPDIQHGSILSDGFNLHIHSEISFEQATRMAAQMKGYEFYYGKRKIKIEDIHVFGKGERAYIRLLLSGSLNGEVYLSGIPSFDKENEELFLSNLDFDIKSKNALIRSASWMLNGMLQKKLQQNLRFSMKTELEKVRHSIRETIRNYRYENLFTLQGKLESFVLYDIFVKEDRFLLVFNAGGQARIFLSNLQF